MKTAIIMALTLVLFTFGIASGDQNGSAGPPNQPPASNDVRQGPGCGPPPEAFAACKNKKEGERSQFTDPRGRTVAGTCRSQANRLVLRPDRPREDSGNRPGNPPPEAYTACAGKKVGDRAQLIDPHGKTLQGTCEELDGKLVLRPDRPKRDHTNQPEA